ncbi:ankyrin repeat domain-containing protein [Providencia alcalifaciens]|uniref:ankyrin repeat domain-containing protein n=1 Tax=Providencia TaxID=586 RepID=UPI001D870251|nr:ankyrin repeat domain-containing protein [Providencia rettgeri]EIU9513526.1 ankyrin repeat domain-containing protein [Providencia rettgeri]EJD6611840.1 ankyrin repeat domain-containing protein [Providencia rettgeri]ELL9147959.1 ankyrin repeat domain-containing protein [Providencia rettgeri]ELR5093990.1 ankyrin repeat domain-containing protein [Providencia rettgeri]
MPFLTPETISSRDELSLAQESLDIYLQHQHVENQSCGGNLWPPKILKNDFLGRDAQPKDYILALLSQGAYNKNWQTIQEIERLDDSELNKLGISAELLSDKQTGFQANICRFYDLYILCFSGSNDISDFYANIRQGIGLYESQYFQAVSLMNVLSNAVNGNTICTGHSLGGGLSSIAALASNSPCIAFSPAGLSKSTVNKVGIDYHMAEKVAQEGLIRFYTVQYDWLDSLQNSLPIPSALGNCIKMPYSEQSSWKNWLPHRLLTRSFIAHTMVKIIKMMCMHKPWNNWNALTGEYNKIQEIPLTVFPNPEEQQVLNWQEGCKKAIKAGDINEFSAILVRHHKPSDIDFLARQSVSAMNGQFMQVLIESQYGQLIKSMQSKEQKSILHLAAQNGQVMQSQILLKNGVTVNIRDSLGNTPLHDAVNSHALEVAELLLASGADWRVKNNQGLDCKDILNNHIIKPELLTHEGKFMREKVFNMMK